MLISRLCLCALLIACIVFIAGCGGSTSDCGVVGLNVTPPSSTADHIAAAPANSEIFSASFLFANHSGCPAILAALVPSNWTASDPSVHLSASPTSQVTATCTAAVAGPVTITATAASGQMLTGQATLTCK
jgi:hypothetical protein